MSYCRCDKDSDVYIIGNSNIGGYNLWFAVGRISCYNRILRYNFNPNGYHFETLQELYNFSLKLKRKGFKVPQRAINRMINELNIFVGDSDHEKDDGIIGIHYDDTELIKSLNSNRYGDNGLNDKPNIQPTSGWN